MSGTWRYELRVRLPEELTNTQLAEIMESASRDYWEVARDPVGITLITYGNEQPPPNGLQLLWQNATEWLTGMGHPGEVVSAEVKDEDLHAEEAVRPDTPELLAATDVAELLGVSRQRVHQLAREHPQFPAPYARLGSGPIWSRPAVEAFARAWTRKPGRPAKAS